MEIGVVVAVAFVFMLIGCALGWRAGVHNGKQTATTVWSIRIRNLESQSNAKLADAKHEQSSIEAKIKDLEIKLRDAKNLAVSKEALLDAAKTRINAERGRYNTLVTPANLVVREQSRAAIMNLQVALQGQQDQEAAESKATQKALAKKLRENED